MDPSSSAATDAAARLWGRVAARATTPGEVGAAADLMCAELRETLGRWIGTGGYLALFQRALAAAREAHPALAEFDGAGNDAPMIAAALRARGAAATTGELVALVAKLIELLGRIIGPEMTVQLVDQVCIPSPRGVVSTQTRGVRDVDQAAASE